MSGSITDMHMTLSMLLEMEDEEMVSHQGLYVRVTAASLLME